MVVLEQCRIDHEGKKLIIEAAVENLSYYRDIYIESVIVDTNDTYSPNGPSNSPVFSQTFEPKHMKVDVREDCNSVKVDENCKCGDVYTSQKAGVKRVRLCLTPKDLKMSSLDDNIFFVYVTATGVPSPCTPCGMDNSFVMGVAVNLRPIYNMAMKYVKELDSACSIPKGFIDMILRLKAFDLSLRTGNYPIAFKQWDKLFKNKVSVSPSRGCGCNGIN